MPDERLYPALRRALQLHELGAADPYRLSFAGKGRSGASFGRLQGDMTAGPAIVRRTFRAALAAAGLAPVRIEAVTARLAGTLDRNPLDAAEAWTVDAALAAPAGRRLIDAMDEALMGGVLRELDRCIDAAAAAGCTITPEAQTMIALWINMSGPPTVLLRWLAGRTVALARPVPPPGKLVDGAAVAEYLRATAYFTTNPGGLDRLRRCAAAGHAPAHVEQTR